MTPVLELRGATKIYGGIPAIDGVDFTLLPSEVHALLGENGAGKSTLTKALAGVVALTSGKIFLHGEEFTPSSPRDSLARGIAMVFQETSLVPGMTVAQNLYLGQTSFFTRLRGIYIAAQQFLQSLNFDVDPTIMVSQLGAAKKQMVEIARAVLHDAKVIIFDEPTATLTPEEKKYFFDLVAKLRQRGISVIFISHALEEALQIADRITILRDGRHVRTDHASNLDRKQIIQAMVGREITGTVYDDSSRKTRPPGKRVLMVQNLRAGALVKNNSLSVFSGQITGVFGLVGAGRTETFKVVAGIAKRDFFRGGQIIFNDKLVRYADPVRAVKSGIAYVTEDRKVEGFFETMSANDNIYIGFLARFFHGLSVSAKKAQELGDLWVQLLSVRAVEESPKVVELSGGNQQKVVIAKSLVQNPGLIIFDEPTRGVDVGAISEIHDQIRRLADEGKAVVVISSYLPEVLSLADRILVMRQGRVVEEFDAANATVEKIMYAAVH